MADEENSETKAASVENGDGTADLKSELEKAKKDYLYLAADFDNFRKNAIKERSELVKYGSERLLREVLGIVDNFDRAMENIGNSESFQAGVQLIHQEFKTLLQRFGVVEVAAEGKPFDPSEHEALSSEPTDKVQAGHVVRVFKKAYKLHDKLIRPAQVVVATAPVTDTKATDNAADSAEKQE